MSGGLPRSILFQRTAILDLRALSVVALLVVLAGCAIPHRAPEVAAPVLIPQSTWQQVDQDIIAASKDATEQVKVYARGSMDHWRARVYQQTEESFIPWFSNYWTQEWLSMRVTWYTLSAGGEKDPSAKRLGLYLQEQYHNRVLDPVALEIDPDAVMGQTTEFYIQLLGKHLQVIAQRYGVPQNQLDRRLKDIPAIALAPPPAHNASLYQMIHADPIARLPAYVALIDRIHDAAAGAGVGSSDAAILSVAIQTNKRLEAELASRGVASVASAATGKVAGMMISMGLAGFHAVEHENARLEREAQLRKNLGTAFDEAWLKLVKSPTYGVMAGVDYLSGQIEGSLAKAVTLPVIIGPAPREVPLPGTQPLQDEKSDEQVPTDNGRVDQ
jgi:hypothetical protein